MNLRDAASFASKVGAGLRAVGLDDNSLADIAIVVTREEFNLLAAQMDSYMCRPAPLREMRINGFLILPNDLPRV